MSIQQPDRERLAALLQECTPASSAFSLIIAETILTSDWFADYRYAIEVLRSVRSFDQMNTSNLPLVLLDCIDAALRAAQPTEGES